MTKTRAVWAYSNHIYSRVQNGHKNRFVSVSIENRIKIFFANGESFIISGKDFYFILLFEKFLSLFSVLFSIGVLNCYNVHHDIQYRVHNTMLAAGIGLGREDTYFSLTYNIIIILRYHHQAHCSFIYTLKYLKFNELNYLTRNIHIIFSSVSIKRKRNKVVLRFYL